MAYSDTPPTTQSKQSLYLEPPQRGDASSSYNRRKRRTKVRDTFVRGLVLLTCTSAVALSYYSCRSCEVISIHNYHPNATNLDLPDFLALTEAADTVFISPFGYAPQEDDFCEYYYQTMVPTSWRKGSKKEGGLQTVEGNHQIGNQGWDLSFVLAQISSLITPVLGVIAWLLVAYSQCRSSCASQIAQPQDRIIFEDDYAAEIETSRTADSTTMSLLCCLFRFVVEVMNRMDNFVNLSILFVTVAILQLGIFLMTFQTNLCHDDIGRQCQLEYFGRLAWVAFALYMLCAIALLAPSLIACIRLLEENDNGGRGRYRPGLTARRGYEDDPDYHSNLYNHRNEDGDSDHGDDPDIKFDHHAPRNSKRSSISMLRGLLDRNRHDQSSDVATEAMDSRRHSDSTEGDAFLFYVSDAAAGEEDDTEHSSESSKRVKRKTLTRVSSYRNKTKRSSNISGDRRHSTRNFSDDDGSIDA